MQKTPYEPACVPRTSPHFFDGNYCVKCGLKQYVTCPEKHLTLYWSNFCGSCGMEMPK